MNEVNLIGNVGQQPDVRDTKNGSKIMKLSLATSEKWKDKGSGERKEKTEWHRVTVFGKTAENLAQYINSGDKLFVRGKIQTSKYQDKNSGEDRYSTDVIVDGFDGKIQMLGSKEGGAPQQQRAPQKQQQRAPQQQQQPPADTDFDDDIPF
jgi:single-strand DNA-binding protein